MNRRANKVKIIFLVLILIAFSIAIISGTYSRYSSSGTLNANSKMAKWSIKLKNTDITTQSTSVSVVAKKIEGVSNNNVSENKIAPAQTLGATLEVDPSGSEVAVDYILEVGNIATENFNAGSSIKVNKVMCTVDGEEAVEAVKYNGTYIFYEDLASVLANKKVTFVAYVTWEDSDTESDTSNGANLGNVVIPINVTAKQHLAQDGYITNNDTSTTLMAAAASLNAGDKLALSEDITYDYAEYPTSGWKKTEFPDDATLDLNGHTVTVPNGALTYIGDNLTVQNGNFVGLISQYGGRYGMHLWNTSDTPDVSTGVVVQNVTTTGINLYNTEVTLKNVTITMPDDAKYYAVYGNVYSTITIESGTYTAGNNTTALFGYLGENSTEAGMTTVDGKNPVDGFKIYGGTFNTNGKPFCLTSGSHIPPVIYGGTFDCDVSAYVADGYTCVSQGNGTWVVQAN